MKPTNNTENHIEALDYAILIDRKRGEFFQLEHITKTIFLATGTNCNKQGVINIAKIQRGLSEKRYRILEVKN